MGRIKIPTYTGDFKGQQCLPDAFAALTGGNTDYWSKRLGYNRPVELVSWGRIMNGIPPNWYLLYTPAISSTGRGLRWSRARYKAKIPRMRLRSYLKNYPGDSVVVVRWGRESLHAIATDGELVYDPFDSSVHETVDYPAKIVLYAWYREGRRK